MTIEWLAGNRIRGTSAEKPVFGLPSGSVGGWVELGRSTASGGETSLSVSSLSDKQYYQVITTDHGIAGAPARLWRFNNDSSGSAGSTGNYSRRVSSNGAADGTSLNQTAHNSLSVNDTSQNLSIHYIANLSNKEKLQITHAVGGNSSAASVAPARVEFVGKWANTSDAINRIDYIANSGSFSSGDEVVVLGWDPADTHTTNFWEELASVDTGAGEVLDSGTFASKKYLWFQFDIVVDAFNNTDATIRFNGDVNGNYSRRLSQDGMATDNTATGQTHMTFTYSGGKKVFGNYFVINNLSNEKLAIGHTSNMVSTGTASPPRRMEIAGKWANTSSQITQIEILDTVQGDLGLTSGRIKVWGSD